MKRSHSLHRVLLESLIFWGVVTGLVICLNAADQTGLVINDQDYFEMPGLNVLVYHNTFSEGHQGGVEIIQHENRVATNGEIRLDSTPGQWQPIAKIGKGVEKAGVSPQTLAVGSRKVDRANNEISMPCSFPDESLNRKGLIRWFIPICTSNSMSM
jgi:endoglucanase